MALGLAAFFCTDARIGARGIDEGDDRQFKPPGQFHQPNRLAVALRSGHAEIALQARLGVVALFLADHHHRLAVETARAADDCQILGELAVAGHGREIADQATDVVAAMRPLGVPGDLGLLPRIELVVEVLERLLRLVLKAADFLVERFGVAVSGNRCQLGNAALQIGDLVFEFQIVFHIDKPDGTPR